LTTTSAALFGLSYMTPIVVCATLGIIADKTHGAVATAYMVATAAMLLTANSYGVFARRYTMAGSAYTYATRTVGPTVGFLVGWLLMLDYCFVPMVIALLTAISLSTLLPHVPLMVWIAAVAALSTLLNALGIRVTDRVNMAIMVVQLLMVVALALLCVAYVLPRAGVAGLLSAPPALNKQMLPAVLAGSAIACYSFLGFDAVSTLSEETLNPKRAIPRAMLIATVLGGLIFTLCAYLMMLVHPSLSFASLDTAAYEIVAMVGNGAFRVSFTIVLVISFFAAVLCAQAGGARLLYVMGRDGTLPMKVFGQLSARSRTPVLNTMLIGIAILGAGVLTTSTSTSYINFGAFSAFFAVNTCVVVDYFRSRRTVRSIAPGSAIAAALGAFICAVLFVNLDPLALKLGAKWFALGMLWLLTLTRVFSRPLPQLHFSGESLETTS
jgi:amino acid transporter